MPVSKKRKKKTRNQYSGPPLPQSALKPKKKITTQTILLYLISAIMIISLAASFLVSGNSHGGTAPTQSGASSQQAIDGENNLLTDP
ncbi:MAG: hypothetical protein AAF485_22210 [Chloroflexota bacterium]